MRTIEEIRQRKNEGKKKWSKDLLEFLEPYFEAGRTYDEIVHILEKDYDIQIDSVSLRNLKHKNKYKIPKSSTLRTAEIIPQYKNSDRSEAVKEENKIVQNQESEKSEIEKSFEEIFGDDNILERQKREREELFRTNSKGAKW